MESGLESCKNSSAGDSQRRPKRRMKTPFQLETLEKAYASGMYPSEATRAELSEQLSLSNRQLQMWFCHRRSKDKKEGVGKKAQVTSAAPVAMKGLFGSATDELMEPEQGTDRGSGSMSKSRSGPGSNSNQGTDDVPLVKSRYELSPWSIMKKKATTCVEKQLGESLREDGPILGLEFDVPPPGAFGAPIVTTEQHWGRSRNSYRSKLLERSNAKKIKAAIRNLHEPADLSIRADAYISPAHFYDSPVDGYRAKRSSFMQQGNGQLSKEYGVGIHEFNVSP